MWSALIDQWQPLQPAGYLLDFSNLAISALASSKLYAGSHESSSAPNLFQLTRYSIRLPSHRFPRIDPTSHYSSLLLSSLLLRSSIVGSASCAAAYNCTRSATRLHRPWAVMAPLIVVRRAQGLKLQWKWQGKPPPCMHNFTLVVQRGWVCHARKVASQRPSRQ